MTTTFSLLVVGFFLGMRHATDADHVIAISTIVSRQRSLKSAAWIGAIWGMGHTLTVMAVGGAILLFSIVIPPRLGLALEFAVGIMLVALGFLTLTGMSLWIRDNVNIVPGGHTHDPNAPHGHAHAHGDYAHSHVHGHGESTHGHREDQTPQAWLDRKLGGLGVYQWVRPLIIGVVHGLAGSAAVALLVLTAIDDPWWGMLYLLLFGVGTIAGMMLVTLVIAAPFAYSSERFPHFNAYLRITFGLLSVGFGLFLMYSIGYVDGLFTDNPKWAPAVTIESTS
ncbi:MAG TPA: sulfite exporter TauE/SafE family protein [Burkholderiales bacterium]|nr:sulfite exporter TauE/SafE family protein [Burkholderiales bacterium]